MIKVAVTGCAGNMGSRIIRTVQAQDNMEVVLGIEIPNTPLEGKDLGEQLGLGTMGVEIIGSQNLKEGLESVKPDVLVDFTIASAAVETVKTCAECGVNVVVGTTGLTDEQLDVMHKAIKDNDVKAVISPNMATGVNVFFEIVGQVAKILGNDYDVEIIEAHHHNKQDAPSGTAKRAAEIIAENLDLNLKENACYGREGMVGKRPKDEIGIHAVRGGDIVGDHTVMFAGDGERIEVVHRASSRQAFANGVIRAINYQNTKQDKNIADMFDVLGL
ncbi:4-hydroxy-tetrahydrodipicolinate reductase [Methanosphaera sp.]|jgi:4-hydroxy-tetrahydrodipicolinate reductase|uniref:4-hydroxy-tetrahydrodipicolinate reductase n=1 Tax=Methanosphaera sp. TaxID=2666342 RepID=UPI002A56E7D5|nr:4-hydroxy-tetrahydrodipicolinate reductase [Methanobacteriaceae archaeon]MDY2744978.1 4-hydroxy-tetrahydrodipicolinate reductase [Methanosphaera sp.]